MSTSCTKRMLSPNSENNSNVYFADLIAQQCYAKYAEIPKTGKPNDRQWTLLSGIVKVEDWSEACSQLNACQVVSLGTGSKCIGQSKLSPNGDILNDSHAEVMARRGFLRYLYFEAHMLYETGKSNIFHLDSKGKCALRDEISFHFFTSHTPCGDASIFKKTDLYLEDNGRCLNLISSKESHEIEHEFLSNVSIKSDGNDKCETLESKNNNKDIYTNNTVCYIGENIGCRKRKNCDTKLNNDSKKQHRSALEEVDEQPRNVGIMPSEEANVRLSRQYPNNFFADVSTVTSDPNELMSTQDIDNDVINCLSGIIATNEKKDYDNKSRQSVNEITFTRCDIDIYRTGAKCLPSESLQDSHQPGVDYHTTGALRTKPGRGDPTLSLSCSDKLARWNAVGIQGALLSLLLAAPVHFSSVVVGGGCPFSQSALYRAIVGRVALQSNSVASPLIVQSSQAFPDAKHRDESKQPCPSSIVWCCVPDNSLEVAVAGRKQGVTKKVSQSPAGRLLICKKELLKQFVKVFLCLQKCGSSALFHQDQYANLSYREWKSLASEYRQKWEAVRLSSFPAWIPKTDVLLEFTVNDKNNQEQLRPRITD